MTNCEEWLDRQEEYESAHLRGFEDALAGVPSEESTSGYHEGFAEGIVTGLIANRVTPAL